MESTETMVANCTIINGTWNPDPKGLSCPVTKFENDTYSAPVSAGKYHDHCIITMHACTWHNDGDIVATPLQYAYYYHYCESCVLAIIIILLHIT